MSRVDHVWTVVCSRAVTDKQSNNVSLENVIEQVAIEGAPEPRGLLPLPVDSMTLWVRSDPDVPARGRMRFTFLSPSSVVLGPREVDVNLENTERFRNQVHLDGLPISEPGRHTFRIELKEDDAEEWREVASVPVMIVFNPPKQEPVEAEAEP